MSQMKLPSFNAWQLCISLVFSYWLTPRLFQSCSVVSFVIFLTYLSNRAILKYKKHFYSSGEGTTFSEVELTKV